MLYAQAKQGVIFFNSGPPTTAGTAFPVYLVNVYIVLDSALLNLYRHFEECSSLHHLRHHPDHGRQTHIDDPVAVGTSSTDINTPWRDWRELLMTISGY